MAAGDRVRITRRGRPVAELAPVSIERNRIDVAALRALTDGAPGRPRRPASSFRTAAQYADRHELALRAADALHLAVASDLGAVLVTLDQRLHAVGPALGVAVQTLLPSP